MMNVRVASRVLAVARSRSELLQIDAPRELDDAGVVVSEEGMRLGPDGGGVAEEEIGAV